MEPSLGKLLDEMDATLGIHEMNKLLDTTHSAVEFFGCPLSKVTVWCWSIALCGHFPEWLRDLWDDTELPRRAYQPLKHAIVFPDFSLMAKTEQIIWVIENLHGAWAMASNVLYFECDDDAVAFKLRWF